MNFEHWFNNERQDNEIYTKVVEIIESRQPTVKVNITSATRLRLEGGGLKLLTELF